MKKIYDGIITALLVIMIMLIAVMFVPKIFKISPYVVRVWNQHILREISFM